MSVAERGRSLAVLGFVIGGGIGVLSATQTWLTATRADGGEPIDVPGSAALALLTPLSLAVLALAAALAIVGPLLRYVFAVFGLVAGGFLAWDTFTILRDAPLSAVASTVTETTGLAGDPAIAATVASVSASAWPVLALGGWILVLAAAVLVLVTARRWRRGGRRFQTRTGAEAHGDGPVDAVSSWDELSHGTDPTR